MNKISYFDYKLIEDESEIFCKIIDILNLLASGKKLPKVIEYDGLVYKNISRGNYNMIYVSENVHGVKRLIFLDDELCDREILNKEVRVIEM